MQTEAQRLQSKHVTDELEARLNQRLEDAKHTRISLAGQDRVYSEAFYDGMIYALGLVFWLLGECDGHSH